MNFATLKSLPRRPWFVGALLAVPAFVGGFTYPGSATKAQAPTDPVIVIRKSELDARITRERIDAARQVLDARAVEGECFMGWKAKPRKGT